MNKGKKMAKKKILHIVESFGSGVFSFLVDLVNNTDKDFDITIAYGVREETLVNFKDYFSDRVKFIKVENFARSINIKKDFKAFLELKKIVKEIDPDIVHLHSSKAGFLGRFATNCRKRKVLYNPHGFSFLMKNSSKIKRTIYWLIEKVAAFRKCTIIGCSNGEYEEALKLTKNAICINNGIDIDKLKEDTKSIKLKENVDFNALKICTVGRIGYQKNPMLFNEIAKTFPDIQFTWIGDGELKNELTSENIKITGWKKREEVLKILNENDVFILTSLWEGLPISLLEAMYMKKICIVSDCIGNRDVIQDNENGYIIRKNNYKDIIQKINKDNYIRLSENAKKDVIDKFNINKMVEEYKKEYKG